MKITLLLLALSLTLFSSGAQSTPQQEGRCFPKKENTHRIMSYNIHHGRGMDSIVNIERIGKLIVDVQPEVVGLQEVDSMVNRSGNIDILHLLSTQTGMYATFGYSILHDGIAEGGVHNHEKRNSARVPGQCAFRFPDALPVVREASGYKRIVVGPRRFELLTPAV